MTVRIRTLAIVGSAMLSLLVVQYAGLRYAFVRAMTNLENQRVVPGSAVDELELLAQLRTIKAGRALVIVHACHSGVISPVLELGDQPMVSTQLPEKTAAAMLTTGSGRVIIMPVANAKYPLSVTVS